MAIDASIYNLANKQNVQPESFGDLMSRQLSMKNAMLQNRMLENQFDQIQSQTKEQKDLQNTIRSSGSLDEALVSAQKLGTKSANEFIKNAYELQQKGVQLDLEKNKLANEHLARVGGGMLALANDPRATPDMVRQYVVDQVNMKNIDPNNARDIVGSLPTDPKYLPEWSKLQAVKLGTAKDVLAFFTPELKQVDLGGKVQFYKHNKLTGQVLPTQSFEKTLSPSEALTIPETQRHNRAMESKPNAAMILNAPGSFDPSQPLADVGMEAIAQAIARKEQPPQEYSVRNPAGKVINARAAVIGGGEILGKSAQATRQAALKDFEPSGTSGKTLSAINTMTEHLATARKAVQALELGDIPLANRIGQQIGLNLGDDRASNAQVIKIFLAGEVAKVASGGHLTDSEIKKAEDNIRTAGSPSQALGALDMMREIAAGKLIAVNQDYQRLTGKSLSEGGRLTPATMKAFQKLEGKKGKASQWQATQPAGNPDMATLGKNPRFKNSVWVGTGAPNGSGWYVRNQDGTITRVE